ncbi:hypothetical protein [Roseateles sp. BYS96W]|uniref:PEP-CTERM sorting domain-containing protein n=1 Tax=Pelomonas nitida TaxID=3299027 RepID=A0ABW7G3A9_9BURK
MKALILAAALAALSSAALAGAPREPKEPTDDARVAVLADAGRLSQATQATITDGGPWAEAMGSADDGAGFDSLTALFEPGQWLILLGVVGAALSRPALRRLRRQEQQRRATALASTLHH